MLGLVWIVFNCGGATCQTLRSSKFFDGRSVTALSGLETDVLKPEMIVSGQKSQKRQIHKNGGVWQADQCDMAMWTTLYI